MEAVKEAQTKVRRQRGTGRNYYVIYGTKVRVKVTMYEPSGYDWDTREPCYYVEVLDASRHPSTAFSIAGLMKRPHETIRRFTKSSALKAYLIDLLGLEVPTSDRDFIRYISKL